MVSAILVRTGMFLGARGVRPQKHANQSGDHYSSVNIYQIFCQQVQFDLVAIDGLVVFLSYNSLLLGEWVIVSRGPLSTSKNL